MPPATDNEWFAPAGLSFTCTQCGNCCTGGPGYVWFSDQEGHAIAKFLKLPIEQFVRRYAHTVNGKWSLNERQSPQGFDCVFLARDDNGKALCTIYPVRPQQCRTWPFWPENLSKPAGWERAAEKCPGIDKGKLYPVEQVRIIRDSNPPA